MFRFEMKVEVIFGSGEANSEFIARIGAGAVVGRILWRLGLIWGAVNCNIKNLLGKAALGADERVGNVYIFGKFRKFDV